jgi:hypothetical protein
MPLKRQIVYPIVFFLLLILISVGLFFASSYLLPGFLESKIISILKKEAGITDFAVDLHELDLEGAHLGSLRIGNAQHPALIVRSIHIDYSPGGIYQKKIKKVVASGVELYYEYKNGQIGFRGFDLEKFLTQLRSDNQKDKTAANQSYPSFPQRIEINNGILIGIVNEKAYRIPFEIDIAPAPDAVNTVSATARLYPRGQTVNISARIDLEQNRIASQLTAKKLDLLRFADIFKSIDGLSLAGDASLEARADMQLAPFKVSTIAGRLNSTAIDIRYKNLRFQNHSDNSDIGKPFIIDFKGPDHQNWQVTVSNFTAVEPIISGVSDMIATLEPNEDGYKVSGNFKLSFDSATGLKTVPVPLRFTKPFDLPLKFSAIYPQNGQWRFDLTNGDRKPSNLRGAAFEYENLHIRTKFPDVHLTGKGVGGDIKAAYQLRIADVRIKSGDVNILCPQLVLKGKTDFIQNEPNRLLSIMDLDLPGTAIAMNASKIVLKNLSVEGQLQRNKKGVQVISATLQLANTDIEAARGDIRLKLAKGSLPLKFPLGNSKQKGSVSISAATYQNLNLGSIKAELRQTASGISFNGKLRNHLIPQLAAKFAGDSDFWGAKDYETRGQFEISYPATGPEIDLGKFFPAAEGFALKGRFLETGSFVIGKDGLSAVVKSSLSDGKLHHPENKLVIEGIQLNLIFPEIPKMQSAPGQQLRFATASAGGLTIENGTVEFQIEPPRTLFIEKGRFSWSDGNVYVQSERISPGVDNYNIILFCDRLNLAKVLDQFGAANVEGKGTVSGRIPLQYQDGRLSFDDGFLFSSPGEGGKIRMKDTEILTAGIPPDTPQYTQMELARKALEDYDYAWAKLNITSEGEDLLLKMQLDGKPAKPLPFVYQTDIGGFAKVEADVQGSTFQGIRLDVNFRLPLNKIMQYKELIQMIQDSRE